MILVIQPNIVLSWICEALDSIRKVREGSQEGEKCEMKLKH